MYKKFTITIVIPCFNEEEGIKNVLERIPSFIDEVIVVDNNSSDKTALIASNLGAIVYQEKQQGYGYACQKGLRAATKDLVVLVDGDGSYPVEEITKLVDFMIKNKLDFVSGSRFPLQEKKSMQRINLFGNFVLSLLFSLLYFHNVKDSQSGMWVVKNSVLSKFKFKNGGMAFSEEVKIEMLLSKNVNFGETYISYMDRKGNSKLSIWKDGFYNLLFLFIKRLEIR